MSKNTKNIAYDFDGVASEGVFEEGSIIITGQPKESNDEILELLADKKPSKIYNYPFDDLEDENGRDIKIGIWKAKTLRVLGIEKFYEDSDEQIRIIHEMSPKTELIRVLDGVPQEAMNFIIFTHEGTILPVAHKLEKEGNRVIVGIIEDNKDILLPEEKHKPEEPEKKKQRMSLYDGMLDKYSADEVLKMMKRIKDKENWIVLTDSNQNFKFTEKALEMGFTKGIFPTAEDRSMEVDRKKAKDFVKEHYPDIEVAEVKSFKLIADGIEFLNQSEELWVLKSAGDRGETIVPESDDIDMARIQVIAALEDMQKDYESNGFILEQKIQKVIELTPEIMFWNGIPITVSLDIENKTIGSGNIGIQTGCTQNLIVKTKFEDRLNKIAFPEIVHEMAKKRTGLFVWDLSILIDTKGRMFFGEYCSQRFGWDCFPTELAMSGDDEGSKIVTPFFASLLYKKNPLRKNYGAAVRIMNVGPYGKMIEEGGVEVKDEASPDVYLYEVKQDKEGKIVSTVQGYDFAVVTGVSDELHEAIDKCYEYIEMITFEGKYYRPKFDFTSYDYSSAIMRRLNYAYEYGLISRPDEDELSTEKLSHD